MCIKIWLKTHLLENDSNKVLSDSEVKILTKLFESRGVFSSDVMRIFSKPVNLFNKRDWNAAILHLVEFYNNEELLKE